MEIVYHNACHLAHGHSVSGRCPANCVGTNKVAVIERLRPDAVAAGNVGCFMQIESLLRRRNSTLPVLHTVELLDRAYESA